MPDLAELPALRDYLDSLAAGERASALDRLAAMGAADLRSLGVSEPLHTELDYRVDTVVEEIPAGLDGTLYRNGPGRWEDHTGRPLHHLFDGDGMVSAFTRETASAGRYSCPGRTGPTRTTAGCSRSNTGSTRTPHVW